MNYAAQPTPATAPDHQQIIGLIGQLDKQRPGSAAHHQLANRHAKRNSAERRVKGVAQAFQRVLFPELEEDGAGSSHVRELAASGCPGEYGQQCRPVRASLSRCCPQRP